MALEVHPLRLAEVTLDTSFRVWQMTPGTQVTAPCTGYLILGGETPVMVDTGIANIFPPFGQTPEQTLQANLARHGLEPGDVGLIVHTHVHVDHVGYDDQLPEARIVIQRGELEYAADPLFPPFLYDPADHAKLTGPLRDRVEIVDGDADIAPGYPHGPYRRAHAAPPDGLRRRAVRAGGHHRRQRVRRRPGRDPGRAARLLREPLRGHGRAGAHQGRRRSRAARCTTATCTSAIPTACGRRARR